MVELTPDQIKGRNMAQLLGVRVFLYTDADGRVIFHSIKPPPNADTLTLVETFEPPAASTPTAFAEAPQIAPE